MAELETAERHLGAALERLQIAVTRRAGRPVGAGSGSNLPDDVVALQEECQTLREVTSHVAERLDSSIAEIDRLLGD